MPKTKKSTDGDISADELLAKLASEGLQIGLDIPIQQWYSTGNMAIDTKTGGGIPVGRIVTFAGAQASGKTTTAVSTARAVLEQGKRVLFCDFERTMDKDYFRSLGVDPDDSSTFVRFNPKTLEEGFNAIRKLVNTGEFGLVIVDSIPAMMTDKERTNDLQTGMDLSLPKQLRAALKQANDYCYENDCTLILLNHLMEKVDITFMGQQMAAKGIKQYTSPGGTGPQFYSSMILWFTKKGAAVTTDLYDNVTNEESKTKIGFEHTVYVQKNKVAKPEGTAVVINIFGEGFSNARTAFEILKAYGVVKKNGSWFTVAKNSPLVEYLPGQVQGEENIYRKLFNGDGRGLAISIAREYLQEEYDNIDTSTDEESEDE